MSALQMSFSLRVSSGVKTVHLLGSWDNYLDQLPLSKDKNSSKSGTWKGTFRFQSGALEPGQRYWYYYIIDGYHVSHNPSEPSTLEPTTGRELNILDVPMSKSSSSKSSSKSSSRHSSSHKSSSKSSRRLSIEIPKGRPLSASQIKSPRPVNPSATRKVVELDEDELCAQFADTAIYEEDLVRDFGTPLSGEGSDLSYTSDSSGSGPSSQLSGSGYSTPNSDYSSCTCERYGITRKGDRVRIDCGGTRCGYEESCSSSEDEKRATTMGSSRRHGVLVRS
jgi:hypothetical protein